VKDEDMAKSVTNEGRSASALISARIAELGGWRGKTLFNASLDGGTRRAIDIPEGEEVDGAAFKALVREAIALNGLGKSKAPKKAKT
jgi:hypothetical protein